MDSINDCGAMYDKSAEIVKMSRFCDVDFMYASIMRCTGVYNFSLSLLYDAESSEHVAELRLLDGVYDERLFKCSSIRECLVCVMCDLCLHSEECYEMLKSCFASYVIESSDVSFMLMRTKQYMLHAGIDSYACGDIVVSLQ